MRNLLQRVSKLVVYTQPTSAAISGRLLQRDMGRCVGRYSWNCCKETEVVQQEVQQRYSGRQMQQKLLQRDLGRNCHKETEADGVRQFYKEM